MRMVRGAHNTAAPVRLIAVSTHSSNVKPRFRGTADFACAIHSHPLPPSREGAIGVDRQKKAQLAESHGQFPSMLTHGSTTRTL
jgi:hypothetical protein